MLKKNREWFYIVAIIFLIIGTLYLNRIEKGNEEGVVREIDDVKSMCTDGGGYWNECGSACAGRNVDYCTQQCVQQCECGFEEYECPSGYTCYQEDGAERGLCKLKK